MHPLFKCLKTLTSVFRRRPDTAAFPRERNGDPLAVEISGVDLVWRIGHDLPARQDPGLDQLANLMMADTEMGRGIASVSHSPFFSAGR